MIACACRCFSFPTGSSAGSRIRRLQNTKQTQTSSFVTIASRSRRLQFNTKQISFFTKTHKYTSSTTVASSRLPQFNAYNNISHHTIPIRIASTSTNSQSSNSPKSIKEIWKALKKTPLQYATIPAVAAFLGLSTNWMGVKMLFYPIEYTGTGMFV